MFDLISWGIGYTLKQGAEWVKGNVLFREDLVQALSQAAVEWNEGLPEKYHMDEPEILFKPFENENLDDRPQLVILRKQLIEGRIPKPETWAKAALQHIQFVRRKLGEPESDSWVKAALEQIPSLPQILANDVNPFYEAADEDIMPHLMELGRRLTMILLQDTKTMLPILFRKLERIESKLDHLVAVADESGAVELERKKK